MFGKLKDMASSAGLEKTVASIEPVVREHLSKAHALGATIVSDDASFAAQIVRPAYVAVVAASHGVTKLIPQFEQRFGQLMLNLRDELIVIEGGVVRLADDFQTRLPQVLINSLKGSGALAPQ